MSAYIGLKGRGIILLLTLFCIASTAFSQSSSNDSARMRYALAKFDRFSHDFGEIQRGEEATAVFSLVNQGLAPLVVENITASCGCTVAEWDKEPLMPQDTMQIKVSYNSNIVGAIKRSVVVKTNDIKRTRTLLTITGNVVKEEE
ncbi:MAG: DUF1573 domain-containing protein [Bacteroidales bacterium]|nr:DUF1573 domain-containing protein [Bacteroidales bacterium]